LIGFTPIDEQVKISQEVREMFKYFVIGGRIEFGMVAAAIQGKVDCEGYISHLISFKVCRPPAITCFRRFAWTLNCRIPNRRISSIPSCFL
jgi:hypothetical protein